MDVMGFKTSINAGAEYWERSMSVFGWKNFKKARRSTSETSFSWRYCSLGISLLISLLVCLVACLLSCLPLVCLLIYVCLVACYLLGSLLACFLFFLACSLLYCLFAWRLAPSLLVNLFSCLHASQLLSSCFLLAYLLTCSLLAICLFLACCFLTGSTDKKTREMQAVLLLIYQHNNV